MPVQAPPDTLTILHWAMPDQAPDSASTVPTHSQLNLDVFFKQKNRTATVRSEQMTSSGWTMPVQHIFDLPDPEKEQTALIRF